MILSGGISADIPALKLKLDTTHADSARVLILARLGFEYAFINVDTSRKYSNEAIELASTIDFSRGHAQAFNNLAISYDISGEYEIALRYFLKALEIYERTGNKTGMAQVYSNCGIVYQNLQELDKSIEFHLKSLEIERERKDTTGIAYSMIHLGGLYLENANFDSSHIFYKEAQKLLDEIKLDDAMCYIHIGLGELFHAQQQYDQANRELIKAIAAFESISDKRGLAQSYVLLGSSQVQLKEYEEAKNHYLTALSYAQELQASHIMVDCFEGLSLINELTGQPDLALQYYKQLKLEEDKILNSEKLANIEELQRKYDVAKKDQEIKLLNQESEYQAVVRNIVIVLLIITLAFLGILYSFFRQKNQAIEELEAQNKLIERKNFIRG